MKQLFLALILFFPVLIFGQDELPPKPAPTPSTKPNRKSVPKAINVTIEGRQLMIGINKLTLPVQRNKLFKLLGKPDVTTPADKNFRGSNRIYTWDNYGIYAYEKPNGTSISEIDFQLNTIGSLYKFSPVSAFTGRLVVDGALITTDSTIEQINQSKKGKLFSEERIKSNYVNIEHGNLVISLTRERNPQEGKTIKLLRLSVYSKTKVN